MRKMDHDSTRPLVCSCGSRPDLEAGCDELADFVCFRILAAGTLGIATELRQLERRRRDEVEVAQFKFFDAQSWKFTRRAQQHQIKIIATDRRPLKTSSCPLFQFF